jgi:hypothetical protein
MIGLTLIASWWPGRYYNVLTWMSDGTSAMERLTESIRQKKPFDEIKTASVSFQSTISRCDRMGVSEEKDIEEPVYRKSYASLEEARAGHGTIVDLVAAGRIPRGDDSD